MRIDAYNQVAQVYGVQKRTNVRKTAYTSPYVSDQISISQTGRDYQIAKNAVAEAPDVREDTVSQLKAMIDSGTYQVEPGDFASKLLEKYNSTISL